MKTKLEKLVDIQSNIFHRDNESAKEKIDKMLLEERQENFIKGCKKKTIAREKMKKINSLMNSQAENCFIKESDTGFIDTKYGYCFTDSRRAYFLNSDYGFSESEKMCCNKDKVETMLDDLIRQNTMAYTEIGIDFLKMQIKEKNTKIKINFDRDYVFFESKYLLEMIEIMGNSILYFQRNGFLLIAYMKNYDNEMAFLFPYAKY